MCHIMVQEGGRRQRGDGGGYTGTDKGAETPKAALGGYTCCEACGLSLPIQTKNTVSFPIQVKRRCRVAEGLRTAMRVLGSFARGGVRQPGRLPVEYRNP
jgi:hypothetical protein